MKRDVKKAVYKVVAVQRKQLYEKHLLRIGQLELNNLLRRKNVFLLAMLNPPPEQLVPDAVKSFSTASLETVFGECLQTVLRSLLKATYPNTMISSGECVDIDIQTSERVRLILELKSGGHTHNRTSRVATGEALDDACARIRLGGSIPYSVHATCYGTKHIKIDKKHWDAQGQTLWYLASKGDSECYKTIVQMFSHQTQAFRRKLERVTNNTIERLMREFKQTYCEDNGATVDWGKIAELSCKNLNPKEREAVERVVFDG